MTAINRDNPMNAPLSDVKEASRQRETVSFSSRRRHTRYWRDWSSDVCSSDLSPHPTASGCCHGFPRARARHQARTPRSAERRVGKECRSRWSPYHQKKQKSCAQRRSASRRTSHNKKLGVMNQHLVHVILAVWIQRGTSDLFFLFKQKTAYEVLA